MVPKPPTTASTDHTDPSTPQRAQAVKMLLSCNLPGSRLLEDAEEDWPEEWLLRLGRETGPEDCV